MKNTENIIIKSKLKNRIEPFLYNDIPEDDISITKIRANYLLTWNRLDLAFKLFYLEFKNSLHSLANSVYQWDIQSQSLGEFSEFGNDKKNTLSDYVDIFETTFKNIKEIGFNANESIIPLSRDGSIYNGAHRTACAIALNKEVVTIKLNLSPMICDFRYYYERKVPEVILEMLVNKFIEYSNNDIYLAFLWPSGKGNHIVSESLFSKVLYRKEISPTHNGAFNLLASLYENMNWAGNKLNEFQGINQKLIECFPRLDSYTVIAFQAEDLKEVRKIKEQVRSIHDIGFSSIHITDTKDEAIKISNLVFNENGIHFLNNATPYKFIKTYKDLESFNQFLIENNVDTKNVLVDGSTTLMLYGIRNSNDLDFLMPNDNILKIPSEQYETHDEQLLYHRKNKNELIFDPQNYFIFNGYKFVSFQQLYFMKNNRNESKDINDCAMMKAHITNNVFAKMLASQKQKMLYCRIKFRQFRIRLLMKMLKKTRLHSPLKKACNKYKSKN